MTFVDGLRGRLRAFWRAVAPHLNKRPALNGLDRKLGNYLNYRDGFFIEAGANDGYRQSNTYFLETHLGWRGLLVEGVPALYEQCKALRTRPVVSQCALVSDDYAEPTITMHFADRMSVVEGALKTTQALNEHVRMGVEVQQLEGTYKVDVPARTLASLLDEIPDLKRIDFLSLDVEGYELDVLKGLHLSKYRPTFILVEARYFEEIDSFLTRRHYRLVEKLSHHDYLYRDSEQR